MAANRKEAEKALDTRRIYRAETVEEAEEALDGFAAGPLGSEVPGDRAELAGELVAGDPVLRVFGADPAGDLHDERDREPEQHGAACGADAGPLPE